MGLRNQVIAVLALLPLLAPVARAATEAPALSRGFRLPVVQVNGRSYYRTFRVTSEQGYRRISDSSNMFRFFGGPDGQYGEALYLFRTVGDAKKFAACEQARGAASRRVIVEVLLPQERFDTVAKNEVPAALDWGMLFSPGRPQSDGLATLRNGSHILYGRWAQLSCANEDFYASMAGAKQFAVVQRGAPSILNQTIFRLHVPRGGSAAER
jgi:hypothetical protein